MSELTVHPAAAVWPMLPDDELDALARSIAEVGLLEPIVVTLDGLLLDGRNRAAACERAEVEPTTVVYDGDPVAYVLARNDRRRHMTKGQRAMAAWMTAATDADVVTVTARDVGIAAGLRDGAMVGWAKTVADHAPDLVGPVIAGARPLKDAYDEARARRDAACGEEARLARLDANAPDLADRVREDGMALDEAVAALDQRERRRTEERRDALALLTRVVDLVAPEQPSLDFVDTWAHHLGDVSEPVVARLDAAIDVLTDLRKRVAS